MRTQQIVGGIRKRRRWTHAVLLPILVGVLAVGAGCHSSSNEDETPEPVPPTTILVRNQAFLDMNIFVFRSTQRIRLGTATGSNTTKFTIPPTLLFGTTPLRFQAVPIGGNRQEVTQEISVTPGDEVNMMIPPN
jgi:hypothetical protein